MKMTVKKRMTRITSVIIALLMLLAMSSSVFAAGITSKSAQSKALKNAKLTKAKVYNLKTKYDKGDRCFDVKFNRNKDKAKFEYEIRKTDGKIVEKSIDYRYKRNSSRKKIGKLAAQKAAAKASGVRLSVVKKGKCKYEYDDGEGIYEVEFRNGKYKYEIEILAPTGKITDYSWEYKGR